MLKRHGQDFWQRDLLGLGEWRYPDYDLVLPPVQPKSVMQKVPETESAGPVRVAQLPLSGMMDAVHARCNNNPVQEFFEGRRQAHIRMMKQDAKK